MKSFYSFQGGVKVCDLQINGWINDCIQKVKEGHTHWSVSSGDTSVIIHVYPSCIALIVANSSGVSRLNFRVDEDETFEFEPYIRPNVDQQ